MAKTDKSYRIRTEVGKDTVLNVPLQRDVDFLEILSLKISQKSLYKLHASNYGVIVGRVLANDGFGVPNARLSVFVPLSDEDFYNSAIYQHYPYTTINTPDGASRRYNLLPDDKNNDCYRIVGTFPNKRLVLDNDVELEIYDKYWKYTTVTNASGDYMIFGVPTGSQTIHLDVDLSNIGVLSQKPRDFMYKGYNITSFDNASQFKESTNLDNLVQIIGQNQNVTVYPFWGDKEAEGEIAITRADINIAYKFETTCIFMGSVITDDQNFSIGYNCDTHKKIGYNRHLTASEGVIEMIRKTRDGLVEEVQIQGNKLIDGDGIWCYQIPMNLDYVVTDEFGNLVPTDNPNKGIATRTSVRFRISITETGDEGFSRHRAEYLVPNNPMPSNFYNKPNNATPTIKNLSIINNAYEFGSATPDYCFRDMFWNKVYSVKNYVPRIQANKGKKTDRYTGLRTTNINDKANPIPFNNVRLKFPFMYQFVCLLVEVFFVIMGAINAIISTINGVICAIVSPIAWLLKGGYKKYCSEGAIHCLSWRMEDDQSANGDIICYAPGCLIGKADKSCRTGGMEDFGNRMQRGLAQENEVVNFDFYNDWINGTLYMPLWYWRKTKKRSYLFGLIKIKPKSLFCSTDRAPKRIYLAQGCAVKYDSSEPFKARIQNEFSLIKLPYGVIHEKLNKDGFKLYYYAPATTTTSNLYTENVPFIRLFATDIILIGSLNDCDMDGVPKLFTSLPSSTSNVPAMVTLLDSDDDETTSDSTASPTVTGLDWMKEGNPPKKTAMGLLFDLSCTNAKTYHKSIINTRRLCELGVTLDSTRYEAVPQNNNIKYIEKEPDGLITRYEIDDANSRAIFATLNHNGLDKLTHNPYTNYVMYKFGYLYPIEFDGALSKVAPSYTSNKTHDNESQSYVLFRYGSENNQGEVNRWRYNDRIPMYNNSFYFYFGLNQGKTALEKFYTRFYADCYENKSEPFTLTTETKPGAWCTQDANAVITSTKINTPYSLVVLDSFNIPFIELSDLEYEKVDIRLWDFSYSEGMSQEEMANKAFDSLIKEGVVSNSQKDEVKEAFNSNGFFVYEDKDNEQYIVYSSDFVNGLYTLKVTDSYGRYIEEQLNLMQRSLSLSINSSNLSTQYEAGKKVDDESSGKIIINTISIDGVTYYFKKGDEKQLKKVGVGEYEIYGYALKDNENNLDSSKTSNTVYFKITVSNDYDVAITSFDDALTKEGYIEGYDVVNGEESSIENQGSIVFNIGVTGTFNIEGFMYCENKKINGKKISDNEFSTSVSIDDSEPLTLLLDGVDTSVLPIQEGFENSKKVATEIINPARYRFPESIFANQEWWEKYVSSLQTLPVTANGDNVEEIDSDTIRLNRAKIIQYKLDSILTFAKACWNQNTQGMIKYSSSGGANPKLYTAYPNYIDIISTTSNKNRLASYEFSDSTTSIQTNGNYPTIIKGNYYVSPDNPAELNDNDKLDNDFVVNSIFKDNLGNRGGVIDLNNQKITKPEGIKKLENLGTYSSLNVDGNDLTNYYNLQTVDKRIDCILTLFKENINRDSIDNVESNIKLIGNKSQIFGGIALAYDNNYNILSEKSTSTEYSYDLDDYNGLVFNENNKERKYYKVQLRTDTTFIPNEIKSNAIPSIVDELEETSKSSYKFPIFKFKRNLTYTGAALFNFELNSCSLDTNVVLETSEDGEGSTDNENNPKQINLSCTISEGDSYDASIGMGRCFGAPYNSMLEIAENDYWNVATKNDRKYRINHKKADPGQRPGDTTYVDNRAQVSYNYSVAVMMDDVTDCDVYTSNPKLYKKSEYAPNGVVNYELIIEHYDRKPVLGLEIKKGFTDDYMSYTPSSSINKDKDTFVALKTKPSVKIKDDEDVRSAVYYKAATNLLIDECFYVVRRQYIDSNHSQSRLDRKAYVYEMSDYYIAHKDSYIKDNWKGIFMIPLNRNGKKDDEVNNLNNWTWVAEYCKRNDITVNGKAYDGKENQGITLIPSDPFARNKDGFCYVIIYLPNVAVDENGKPMVALKINNSVYGDAFLIGKNESDDEHENLQEAQKLGCCFIPLINPNATDEYSEQLKKLIDEGKIDDKKFFDKYKFGGDFMSGATNEEKYELWQEEWEAQWDSDVQFVNVGWVKNGDVYVYAKHSTDNLYYKLRINKTDNRLGDADNGKLVDINLADPFEDATVEINGKNIKYHKATKPSIPYEKRDDSIWDKIF